MTLIQQRVRRLQQALRRYGSDDTLKDCLTDLLADARHWCDRHKESYAAIDKTAYRHYLADLADERRIVRLKGGDQ